MQETLPSASFQITQLKEILLQLPLLPSIPDKLIILLPVPAAKSSHHILVLHFLLCSFMIKC
jgi:hypothetical protein